MVRCDRCGVEIPVSASYVVRIEAFADPSMPAVSAETLEAIDFDEAFRAIIEEAKRYSTEELNDQVHRRFEFRLCPSCHRNFIANPLAKPRVQSPGHN
jgi:hypothetical protein